VLSCDSERVGPLWPYSWLLSVKLKGRLALRSSQILPFIASLADRAFGFSSRSQPALIVVGARSRCCNGGVGGEVQGCRDPSQLSVAQLTGTAANYLQLQDKYPAL
jgi:hypothetical protein